MTTSAEAKAALADLQAMLLLAPRAAAAAGNTEIDDDDGNDSGDPPAQTVASSGIPIVATFGEEKRPVSPRPRPPTTATQRSPKAKKRKRESATLSKARFSAKMNAERQKQFGEWYKSQSNRKVKALFDFVKELAEMRQRPRFTWSRLMSEWWNLPPETVTKRKFGYHGDFETETLPLLLNNPVKIAIQTSLVRVRQRSDADTIVCDQSLHLFLSDSRIRPEFMILVSLSIDAIGPMSETKGISVTVINGNKDGIERALDQICCIRPYTKAADGSLVPFKEGTSAAQVVWY